jgi:hypothetical protein
VAEMARKIGEDAVAAAKAAREEEEEK